MLIAVSDTEVGLPEPSVRVGIKLSHPARMAAFVLGLAGLGAGGVAVFKTHLEAGPVGLLAVGLIFMIVGLSGTLPTRLKVGDNEAAWEMERQAVETFVERVAEDVPVANRREFLGALDDLAEDAPRFATPLYSALAYERLVMSMLEDAISTLNEDVNLLSPTMQWQPREAPDVKMDAVVSTADGRTLIVELKASQRVWARDVLRQLERYRSRMPGLSGALLVSKYPVKGGDLLTREPYTYYVVVAGREDQSELTRVMRRALENLPKARHDNGKVLDRCHKQPHRPVRRLFGFHFSSLPSASRAR